MISAKSGKDISELSDHETEQEVLLRHGLVFKVVQKIEIPNGEEWTPNKVLLGEKIEHWNADKVLKALSLIRKKQKTRILFLLQEVDAFLVEEVCKSKKNSFTGDVEIWPKQ
jgi:hypothetical protein